jgi:hypothetical protein
MKFLLNEGSLQLPSDSFHDASINMLRFESLGTTLVVSRARLKNGETLEENFDSQVKKLESQMKDLRFQQKRVLNVGVGGSLAAIEVRNQFQNGKDYVYQMQLVCELPGQRVMALSYVKPSPLGDAEMEHWRIILQGIDFS